MATSSKPFPIVGIGSSAGGVEALGSFFSAAPAAGGIAYVVVTHLSPDYKTMLPEIIGRHTTMPVTLARQGAEVRPNRVYVLPADAILGIDRGRLTIRRQSKEHRERKPIDIFLSSLAMDQGEYAAGVILSGRDGDGTLGIKAIKERGGLTMAQAPGANGPSHPQMPESAISTGLVDLAIPADQMGDKLLEFARGFDLLGAGAPEQPGPSADAEWATAHETICAILRNQVGHDFQGYKAKTFMRRVQRRMQVTQSKTVADYVATLRKDLKEVSALFRDLLINVTNFFRDAEAFEALETLVLPKLFAGRGVGDTIRIWVPGCATGEEAYTIAMLAQERLDRMSAKPQVQIFATDIDERALAVARAARYPTALLDSVSQERGDRFFVADGGAYQISREVRDLCIFSPHSVIRDPPFSRMDLVSCRNLLIYFGPDIQSQVIPTFYYSLRPGGFLFLGTSETVSQFGDLFTAVDKKQRIFRRRDDVVGVNGLPRSVRGVTPMMEASQAGQPRGQLAGAAIRHSVERQVIERHAPAHVLVNDQGDVVYYSGRTGKYLEPAPGLPSRHLIGMTKKGLRLELRTALQTAMETGHAVVRPGAAVEGEDGRVQMVTLTVEPLAERRDNENLFLVLFSDEGPMLSREQAEARTVLRGEEAASHLETELRETRERLQALIEEYETALEELKSSNEELVSVNEELQSSNEELEASKEELQSLNEELHTVNSELHGKVDQLDRANSDLSNLFASTQIATVFLDRNLVIRSFTPDVKRIFSILPTDKGRPLSDLSSRLPLPDLAADVQSVLESGESIERQIADEGPNVFFLLRLIPYRNSEVRVQGVVVTFVDVTTLVQAEKQQRVLVAELNHRVKNMLALVIAIADQMATPGQSLAQYKTTLIQRLRAMARSYGAISRERWVDVSLANIVKDELEPFGLQRVSLDGPALRVRPRQALSLGMVLHELATNAGKYGALSRAEGRVKVTWSSQDGRLTLHWREQGGPSAAVPQETGFGMQLIQREIGYTLRGTSEIRFDPTGLSVTLTCPL
ncbi:CheR family methyltransferase [Alsobacter sp. SYSU BS001988]